MAQSARIDEYTSQIKIGGNARLPEMEYARPPAAIDINADKIVSGLNSIVKAREDRAEEEGRAWGASALSKARLDWTTQLVERQSKAGPNAPDFTPTLINDFDEYSKEVISRAPTKQAKAFLTSRLEEFKVSIGSQAMAFEAQARIDYRTDQFSEGISNTQKLMNTDPSQYKEALAEQLAFIDSSALPPLKKSAMRQKAIENISSAAVWSQIQKSPTAFMESIGFFGDREPDGKIKTRKSSGTLNGVTGNIAFDALPFEKRVQIFGQAVTMKAQMDSDLASAAKAKQVELSDEVAKQGWNRIYSGKLSDARNYIETNKAVLSAPVYHSLLSAMRSEERHNAADARAAASAGNAPQRSDPGAFREVQKLIAEGKSDEAQKLAFTYHQSGRLSNEHLASNVSHAQTMERQGGPKTAYERGRQFITGSLDPGPMVSDPIGRARQANAVDMFDTWMKSGKRTDAEIDARAKEVVDQTKFINLSDTVMALPKPRSGDIPRTTNPVILNEAIAKAGRTAKERLDSGQYNQREYEAEIMNLNRWRRAASQAPAQQGKANERR